MEARSAYVFINFEQAVGLGHIGWGFQVDDDQYYFGSTDHLWNTKYPIWHPIELIRYMDVAPAANNDYWAQLGTEEDMLHIMQTGDHVRYHAYKKLAVENPDPAGAKVRADTMEHNGWNVALNNCVHQSYKVLSTYGAQGLLPCPYKLSNRIPRKWFGLIESDIVVLQPRVRNILPLIMHQHRRAS